MGMLPKVCQPLSVGAVVEASGHRTILKMRFSASSDLGGDVRFQYLPQRQFGSMEPRFDRSFVAVHDFSDGLVTKALVLLEDEYQPLILW